MCTFFHKIRISSRQIMHDFPGLEGLKLKGSKVSWSSTSSVGVSERIHSLRKNEYSQVINLIETVYS